MIFSAQQEAALLAAKRWLDAGGEHPFRLFGYAGTGKTTLATTLAEGVRGQVFFAAYTGKAASVMRARGCPGATTIHQLIYKPAGKSTKTLVELEERLEELLKTGAVEDAPQVLQLRKTIREEVEQVQRPSFIINPDSALHRAALVIIDECSMVDERIGQDLLSFRKPILVLGDPAQLPPVRGEGFFTQDGRPDVMLTEIHRQARDNPIIHLATQVRQGKTLLVGQYGSSCVLPTGSFTGTLAKAADQIIVGRNATRRSFNQNYRKSILGLQSSLPCVGDKLVCLRNNHEIGILNGGLWKVEETSAPEDDSIELVVRDEQMSLRLSTHRAIFEGNEIAWWQRKEHEEFDYGYSLTAHKSQGSQWNKVLVFDESRCFQQHAKNWLYTAVTRAAESITILQT